MEPEAIKQWVARIKAKILGDEGVPEVPKEIAKSVAVQKAIDNVRDVFGEVEEVHFESITPEQYAEQVRRGIPRMVITRET